ncbi:MAG: hypothetical protein ACHQ1D_00180 [Nitrososphaerales archaeon]
MSELKPESILSFLGFKPEEIKTEEDFKSNFESKFGIKDQLLKDPAFTGKIFGQRVGSIEAKLKSNAKKMGVEFTPDEIKDKSVEEIQEIAFTKIAELNKKAMEDLEKSTKGTVDEQVKSWKEKYQSVESKLKETEGLLSKTSSDYEGFKKEAINKSKSDIITRFKKETLDKLKFRQGTTSIHKLGFETDINSKYEVDLDEHENPFVKDKKTGQRIPSKKVTGQFMTADEIFNEELVKNDMAELNKDGGKPAPRQASVFNGMATTANHDSINGSGQALYGKRFMTAKQG